MAAPTLTTHRDIVHPQVDARGGGNVNTTHMTEHSKLLPWLMLSTLLGGLSLGMAVMTVVSQGQTDARMRGDLDRQYRFLQELRVRVEDAEMAAKQVNPTFKSPRQPKEH